jgi:hypothetical protein
MCPDVGRPLCVSNADLVPVGTKPSRPQAQGLGFVTRHGVKPAAVPPTAHVDGGSKWRRGAAEFGGAVLVKVSERREGVSREKSESVCRGV